jgi:hypothetical protein
VIGAIASPFPHKDAAGGATSASAGKVRGSGGDTVRDGGVTGQAVYQVKHGWNSITTVFAVVFAGFAAISLMAWSQSPLGAVILAGIPGGLGLLAMVDALRGNQALRVDSEGITLGSSPVRKAIPGRIVPWSDIEVIVLFDVPTGRSSVGYLGIKRRQGLERLPGSPGDRTLRMFPVIPGVPLAANPDIQATSVAIGSWYLNKARLTQAIALNASQVPLWDHRK